MFLLAGGYQLCHTGREIVRVSADHGTLQPYIHLRRIPQRKDLNGTNRPFGHQRSCSQRQAPVHDPVKPLSRLSQLKDAAAVRPGAERPVSGIGLQHGYHHRGEISLPVLSFLHMVNEHGKMKMLPEAGHHTVETICMPGYLIKDPGGDVPVLFKIGTEPHHEKAQRVPFFNLIGRFQRGYRFLRPGQDSGHRAPHHVLPVQKHIPLFIPAKLSLRRLHCPFQFPDPHRLEQITLYAKLQRLLRVAEIRISGQNHCLTDDPLFSQLPQHGQAVHIRHADIQKDHVRLQRPDQFQAFPAVRRFCDHLIRRIQLLQNPLHPFPDRCLVFHDYYFQSFPLPSSAV